MSKQGQSSAKRLQMLPYLGKRFDRVGRKLAYRATNRAEWQRWRRALRRQLKSLTGYDTMVRSPLKPKITEAVRCDGYVRQRVEIQTEPDVVMPLYVLIPDGLKRGERSPAVICPHGHGSGGKLSPAGRADIPEIAETIKQHNYDYGVQFVRQGLIVFCPDARGFGERQEASLRAAGESIIASSCLWINQMAYPLGQTVTGMWAWDLHRLVDYIQTRKDCQPDRIGCAGLSGGGLQTLWASALDDRIRCAVVSGYFYGYKEALLEMHMNCSCNYVPHLYEYADMGDIGALIAPRPLLIETGTKDQLNGKSGVRNVKSQVSITRRAYKLLGATKHLVHDVFEGEHRWHGKVALPFVTQCLTGS